MEKTAVFHPTNHYQIRLDCISQWRNTCRMTAIKHISILGAGALGAFYASKLFEMDPTCVSFVANGERYNRLQANGVTVNKTHYAIPVMTPEDTSPPSGLIIVALKHHHLPAATPTIANRVGEQTTIISVMNGLDSEAYLGAQYGEEKVLFGVAVGIDALREGNQVVYTKQGKLFFGEAENTILTKRVQQVQQLFGRAGIAYETPVDMMRTLWWKFMINVGINQTSAVLRAPYGTFQQSSDAQAIMEAAMQEVIAIAKAADINLVQKDVENWYTFMETLSPHGKTSMLQDIEAQRKTEVAMFAGKVVELGSQYDIPTPVNQMLLRMIRVLEFRANQEQHGCSD